MIILNRSHLSLAAMFCGKVCGLLGGIHSNVAALRHISWLVGWLVSLFTQGKPLASGYYSRHPETIQYNKDTKTKMRGKGTKAG